MVSVPTDDKINYKQNEYENDHMTKEFKKGILKLIEKLILTKELKFENLTKWFLFTTANLRKTSARFMYEP